MRLVFIGAGGTNTWAMRAALTYLNGIEGQHSVLIIDGDSYDKGNLDRQDFDPSMIKINKAEAKAEEFSQRYPDIEINFMDCYVDEDNINYILREGDIIFLAIDCYKARGIVDNRCQEMSTILLISMGNEETDGDVSLMCKINDKYCSPSIQEGHPEIKNAKNKTRSEMSCEEILSMPGGGQHVVANFMAGASGMQGFYMAMQETKNLTSFAKLSYAGNYFSVFKSRPVTNHVEG